MQPVEPTAMTGRWGRVADRHGMRYGDLSTRNVAAI